MINELKHGDTIIAKRDFGDLAGGGGILVEGNKYTAKIDGCGWVYVSNGGNHILAWLYVPGKYDLTGLVKVIPQQTEAQKELSTLKAQHVELGAQIEKLEKTL